MNIPIEIVTALFTAILGVQAYLVKEVIKLRTEVAVLTDRVFHGKKKAEEED